MRAVPSGETMRATALTLASGVLYGVCFPTWSLQSLAWIALVPFLVALRQVERHTALALGWLWTLAAAATLGNWFPGAISNYYRQSFAVGMGFFLGVSSLMAAPYYMAFAVWYRRVAMAPTAGLPLLTAAAWVAAELARARYLGANPWGLFGYSQVGHDALVQIADVTSVYGVSFALVAVNAALAEIVIARRRGARLPVVGAALAVAVALVLPLYASVRTATLPAASGPPVEVGVVQGNVDVGTQWSEELYGKNLDVYLRLTAELLQSHRPALVIWPENGLTFFLEDEPSYRAAIAHVIAPSRTELLAGGPRTVALAAGPAYYNSMFLLTPDGDVRARYDKQHLVPFGERFPIPSIAVLARRFERVRELSPGPFAAPIATVAGLAGITICSEAMFPELAATRVRDGAAFFVDPAHDTWLTPKFSAQQFDIVRLRTIEERRYLARASTSGPSAIVDPLGHVVARSDFFTRAAFSAPIEPRNDRTVYQRVGDLFAGLCTLVALAAFVRARRH